ncbi:MAG: hypothetical protein JST19_03490, partial [Bacteroidetes bacterium]|nr:hypothetical protein [Bacteroidota bacterium]
MDKFYQVLFRIKKYSVIPLGFVFVLFFSFDARAQYFGQNKVRYKNLKFKVYRTPHFEIYYYMKNDSLLKRF